MMRFDEYYDVVIVGTGAAGLYCALNFPKRYKVLLLTKQKADECDSFLAQGGICMQHGEADYRSFFEDTMRAGHYENDAATVDLMIRSSNSIIRDLVRRGVRFARDENGALRFTREGAHSRARILFHEDVTGREITQTLLAEALRCENIELRENTVMLDFFADAAACGGVVAMGPDGAGRAIGAGAVVTDNVPDHALMLGVPARRCGWACECGELLKNGLNCPKCGRKYREGENGLTEVKD